MLQYCLNPSSFDALPEDLRAQFYRLMRIRSQIAAQRYYSGPLEEEARTRLREAGIEFYTVGPVERENWRDRLSPIREAFIRSNEAAGRPARDMVESLETLAARYAQVPAEEIMQQVTERPVPGIIDL